MKTLNASKKDVIGPWKKILSYCRTREISTIVVHHDSPILHLYLLLIKKFFPHITTIAYAHGNAEGLRGGGSNRGLKVRRFLIKKSLLNADRVIAISRSVCNSLHSFYKIPLERITIVYNGVKVGDMCNELHMAHKPINLIYVGRLIPLKGVQVILEALAKLPHSIKWNFMIVGDGIYRQSLENLTKQLSLEDKVFFWGTCRDVPERLKMADIFVHAPILEEGFGITIVEAMASGLLCVCARSGGIPEIIVDGENGFLFEKEDVCQLEKIIYKCIVDYDSDLYCSIRKKAVSDAQNFSIEKYVERMDALLGGKI